MFFFNWEPLIAIHMFFFDDLLSRKSHKEEPPKPSRKENNAPNPKTLF